MYVYFVYLYNTFFRQKRKFVHFCLVYYAHTLYVYVYFYIECSKRTIFRFNNLITISCSVSSLKIVAKKRRHYFVKIYYILVM